MISKLWVMKIYILLQAHGYHHHLRTFKVQKCTFVMAMQLCTFYSLGVRKVYLSI